MKLETQLKRLGFKLEHQGGGMHNWRLHIPEHGIELFCGDAGGGEPDDEHPVHYGVMPNDSAGDNLCMREYATGAELADVLAELRKEPTAQELAKEFSAVINHWLKPEQLDQVVEDNHRYQAKGESGICATGDFCDSNMAMCEAYFRLAGRAIDPSDEAQAALWNAAWDLAKKADFKL